MINPNGINFMEKWGLEKDSEMARALLDVECQVYETGSRHILFDEMWETLNDPKHELVNLPKEDVLRAALKRLHSAGLVNLSGGVGSNWRIELLVSAMDDVPVAARTMLGFPSSAGPAV